MERERENETEKLPISARQREREGSRARERENEQQTQKYGQIPSKPAKPTRTERGRERERKTLFCPSDREKERADQNPLSL